MKLSPSAKDCRDTHWDSEAGWRLSTGAVVQEDSVSTSSSGGKKRRGVDLPLGCFCLLLAVSQLLCSTTAASKQLCPRSLKSFKKSPVPTVSQWKDMGLLHSAWTSPALTCARQPSSAVHLTFTQLCLALDVIYCSGPQHLSDHPTAFAKPSKGPFTSKFQVSRCFPLAEAGPSPTLSLPTHSCRKSESC